MKDECLSCVPQGTPFPVQSKSEVDVLVSPEAVVGGIEAQVAEAATMQREVASVQTVVWPRMIVQFGELREPAIEDLAVVRLRGDPGSPVEEIAVTRNRISVEAVGVNEDSVPDEDAFLVATDEPNVLLNGAPTRHAVGIQEDQALMLCAVDTQVASGARLEMPSEKLRTAQHLESLSRAA